MKKLKEKLMLSEKGYADLKKAIVACTITNIALTFPLCIAILAVIEIIKPLTGEDVSWTNMWGLFGLGILSAFLVFLAAKNDYKKTYVTSYQESSSTRIRVVDYLRKLPMSFFSHKDLSEITTNMMADCGSMESMLSSTIPPLVSNIISITLTCVFLLFFNWKLALAIFCTLPISFLIIYLGVGIEKRMFEKQVQAKLKASEQVQEYLEGIKMIKAYGLSGERFTTLNYAFQSMRKIAIKVELVVGLFVCSASMILQSSLGITVFIGSILIVEGSVEFIPLLMFFLFAMRAYGPVLAIFSQLSTLLHLETVTNRMRILLTTKAMEGEQCGLTNYDITLKNISFAYGKETVIYNLSANIKQGETTALVGPSGSGKSTLAKLIARFWDVNEGGVFIGGKDIKKIDPQSLMKYMSFVFQDVILFNDTIYNNIRIGNMEATEEKIIIAAKRAYCDEFIKKLPDGYQTVLGENGGTLSGGQRQRISIARAILKNAPIIILDEETASLDPENEVLIGRAIAKLIEGKTVIMIAHRLRTVVDVDQIIVLSQGDIAQRGTHLVLQQ